MMHSFFNKMKRAAPLMRVMPLGDRNFIRDDEYSYCEAGTYHFAVERTNLMEQYYLLATCKRKSEEVKTGILLFVKSFILRVTIQSAPSSKAELYWVASS